MRAAGDSRVEAQVRASALLAVPDLAVGTVLRMCGLESEFVRKTGGS